MRGSKDSTRVQLVQALLSSGVVEAHVLSPPKSTMASAHVPGLEASGERELNRGHGLPAVRTPLVASVMSACMAGSDLSR